MPSPAPPTALHFVLLFFSGWVNRHQDQVIDYPIEENRVLREQLDGRRLHLNDLQRRRLAVKGKALGRKALGEVAWLVTPDTILRWYRQLVAKKYDGSRRRGPGRPSTDQQIADLVVRMARDNVSWGYTRLRDALRHLGHEIARNTVKRILLDHGIVPAPERNRKTPLRGEPTRPRSSCLSARGHVFGRREERSPPWHPFRNGPQRVDRVFAPHGVGPPPRRTITPRGAPHRTAPPSPPERRAQPGGLRRAPPSGQPAARAAGPARALWT